MNLLITGAAGFIGSHLVRTWSAERPDDRIVAFDALTYAGDRDNLADVAEAITFVHADITDPDAVDAAVTSHEIDVIVNVAAESHNSLAVIDPGRFFHTNVMGTQILLDAARRHGSLRFHHISTCEVYGDLDLDTDERFSESSPYRPRTPYNASKAAADHAVRAYHHTYGLPTTISNCANNYGPYQFPEKVIPLFITLAIQDEPLPLYASVDHRREWIHVSDHVRAIMRVVLDGGIGETYNVGTGDERTIEQVADAVLGELGKPASLKQVVTDRPGHDRRYLLDSAKIADELGWAPEIAFDDGLRDTVAWFVENPGWWRARRGRAPVEERAWT